MADSGRAAVDFGYLERFASGDLQVVREILELFVQEAKSWAPRLRPEAADWRDVVHTIKGSGRGIGAFALGDACEAGEIKGEAGLPAVREALAEALAAIEAYAGG